MNASMKARTDRASFDLIRMSTRNLVDDTRIRLVVPLRVASIATATIAECLAAKLVSHV